MVVRLVRLLVELKPVEMASFSSLFSVIQDAAEFEDYLGIVTLHSEFRQVIKREQFLKQLTRRSSGGDGLYRHMGLAGALTGSRYLSGATSIKIGTSTGIGSITAK